MDIAGSSAVVTGGASGLGLATARRLAAQGAHVVIVDLPSSAGADIAAELDGTFAAADVTDAAQVEAAVAAASAVAPLRVAVNCAGIAPPAKVLARDGSPNPVADFERIVRINLIGTYTVIAHAAAAMAATEPTASGDRGVIVGTASVAAFDGQIGQPAYSASKGGVHAMTEAAQESLGHQVPYPARLGRPDEYASLVQHIVENGYLNGETIRLDGSIRMAPR